MFWKKHVLKYIIRNSWKILKKAATVNETIRTISWHFFYEKILSVQKVPKLKTNDLHPLRSFHAQKKNCCFCCFLFASFCFCLLVLVEIVLVASFTILLNQKLTSYFCNKLKNLSGETPWLTELSFLVSPCYLMSCQWSSSDLPQVLRIWESVFYYQAFLTLHSFLHVSRLPWGRQFNLKVSRASCWSLKHSPAVIIHLSHNNP